MPADPEPGRLSVVPHVNEEFDAHAWVEPKDLGAYDLNAATRITLLAKGLLSS